MTTSTTISYSTSCPYCSMGGHTVARCPEVREVHYRKDGTIARVVKMSPAEKTVAAPLFQHWPTYPTAPIQYTYTGTGDLLAFNRRDGGPDGGTAAIVKAS